MATTLSTTFHRSNYCGAQGTTTHTQHSWHDSTDCARCGGSVGYAIGD